MRTKYIIGNWKMNQNLSQIHDFFGVLKSEKFKSTCEAWVAPQYIHVSRCLELGKEVNIKVGAQNCSYEINGAYTGEVSPESLKDIGAHFTLLGHSERRTLFQEENDIINKKIQLALKNNLVVVFCLGETFKEREDEQTFNVIEKQIIEGLDSIKEAFNPKNLIIAYEPVWAIGTGKTATPEMANEVHLFIRKILTERLGLNGQDFSVLYGGSVKPTNISELMNQDNIDGALVGGASLKSSDFRALTDACS